MPTGPGIDFGVAFDRDTLGLMESGSSEVFGMTLDVDLYMRNYSHLSGLLLELQKFEDNFLEVLKPSM